MIDEEWPEVPNTPARAHWVVTGTGSSEAHARYLVWLLNRFTPHTAEFRALSGFLGRQGREEAVLVVFSQGLSPNATFAMAESARFERLVLFTSSTPQGLRRNGKEDRARLLERLADEGATLVRFPLEEEFTTLMRVVGPMTGYLAAAQFVAGLEGSGLPRPEADLCAGVEDAPANLPAKLREFSREDLAGCQIVATDPLVGFAQNLAYKFLEGLLLPAPGIWDAFQYAHGPFQQNVLTRRPVLLLVDDSEENGELEKRIVAVNEASGCPTWTLKSRQPQAYRIFEYEALFNELTLSAIERSRIDQINWPGKNLDGPVYGYGRWE